MWRVGQGRDESDFGCANMKPPGPKGAKGVSLLPVVICLELTDVEVSVPYTRMELGWDKRLCHSSKDEWCVGGEDADLKISLERSRTGSIAALDVPDPGVHIVKDLSCAIGTGQPCIDGPVVLILLNTLPWIVAAGLRTWAVTTVSF